MAISRSQSYEKPTAFGCLLNVAMFWSVVTLGCVPVRIAYCSAGRPKTIPSHRVKTLKPRCRLKRAVMGSCIPKQMSDVQPRARRVRKHIEDIIFWLFRIDGRAKGLLVFPTGLPFLFYCLVIVLFHDFQWERVYIG